MSKLNHFITLSLLMVLVITGNVYSHQYAPRPKPTFPYTKFSQKPKVVRRVKIQVPIVHDVETDKFIPNITTIQEKQNHKLREFDLLHILNLNLLRVPKVPDCYTVGHICLGEIPLPSLLPPIISPIEDPFNGDSYKWMSLEEFFLWLRQYRSIENRQHRFNIW